MPKCWPMGIAVFEELINEGLIDDRDVAGGGGVFFGDGAAENDFGADGVEESGVMRTSRRWCLP
jgi:hypothetical protein